MQVPTVLPMQETKTVGLPTVACKIKEFIAPPCPKETRVYIHYQQQFSEVCANANHANN
jgi:hypothetical protein